MELSRWINTFIHTQDGRLLIVNYPMRGGHSDVPPLTDAALNFKIKASKQKEIKVDIKLQTSDKNTREANVSFSCLM